MKRYIQYEFLKVSHFEVDTWKHPEHNHNHFELIFIHGGSGRHHLNGCAYPYGPRQLFLLRPSDVHSFEITEKTRFTFLKFSARYLKGTGEIQVESRWQTDRLLTDEGSIALSENDYEILENLLALIRGEWERSRQDDNETLFFLVQTVFSLLKRNHQPAHQPETDRITAITDYIHAHIYSMEETRVERLADEFHLSRHYLGDFFREQTGVTLREYIRRYKLRLIEDRLRLSRMTVKEIGFEFGFTDLSHLNKFFRASHGISPKEYRRRQEASTRSAATN
ncbi:helix-turn-helix domain-containing protein [Siphonobacter aquaeclarae]|uniref:AraC-type DNA-binding protein n=1 Tax=Siphonobacter aquaeclarae TaxID=563176 RepID=A0A1G9PRW8_9BACT|nr:AraC family transcriptional regulator [Siphonobacter aquaeclarae]SDM01514.1 AraC-type DNA-binding protein [Siphonobacter aquaeclarae]